LFRPRCEKAEPDLEVIKTLAHDFNTTLTATALRFIEECREMCLVVFSEHGRVRWWRAGNKYTDIWIEPRQTLHRESLAWSCLHDIAVPEAMQQVPAEVWVQEQRRRLKVELYEQSIRLGRYPTILTLLWIIEGEEGEDSFSR